MLKISLLLITFFVSLPGYSQGIIGYGDRKCVYQSEMRIIINGSDICAETVNCEHYQLPNPDRFTKVRKWAFCHPDRATGRCPTDGQKCLDDNEFTPVERAGLENAVEKQMPGCDTGKQIVIDSNPPGNRGRR